MILYKIAICDDEDTLIRELQDYLERYSDEMGQEFCYFSYYDGSELLRGYRPDFDLIFLDIKMEQLNGLKTAEEIRRIDRSVGLIFLTSMKQYVFNGYEYNAINYLLKPVKYSILKMELDRYFTYYHGKDEPYLSFSNDSGKYKALYKDLSYAETEKRNVMLHFQGQEQVIYKNMKEVARLLCAQPGFVRCHQSFVVNLSFVKGMEGMDVVLSTGERIPVSQPRRKEFMARLADYWGDML